MSRGDRREDIFRDDRDRERFLETLAETCAKTGWQVQAYCLMRNHFHLVVETPQANLVAGMKWFLGTYTVRFNRRHQLTGHLFSGRYKAQLVSGEGGYLRTVCDYVHLNPVRAGLLAAAVPLKSYRWSSFPAYLAAPAQRPKWLRVERWLGEHGIPRDSDAGRRELERRLETRRAQEADADHAAVRNDWCLGDEQFRKDLLAQAATKVGPNHYGAAVRETAMAKAEQIVTEELAQLEWPESELAARRKGDPAKLAIANRLRRETTVTLQWIAERLQMGARSYLSHLLYWEGRAKTRRKPAAPRLAPMVKQFVSLSSTPNTSKPLTDPEPVDPMSYD